LKLHSPGTPDDIKPKRSALSSQDGNLSVEFCVCAVMTPLIVFLMTFIIICHLADAGSNFVRYFQETIASSQKHKYMWMWTCDFSDIPVIQYTC